MEMGYLINSPTAQRPLYAFAGTCWSDPPTTHLQVRRKARDQYNILNSTLSHELEGLSAVIVSAVAFAGIRSSSRRVFNTKNRGWNLIQDLRSWRPEYEAVLRVPCFIGMPP